MSRERTARNLRTAGCAGLVALLAVCSYMGARQPQAQTVSVPVAVETISESVLSAASLEETLDALQREREDALALMQSVIDDPNAGTDAKEEALKEKTALAKRMAAEAEMTRIRTRIKTRTRTRISRTISRIRTTRISSRIRTTRTSRTRIRASPREPSPNSRPVRC